MRRRAASESLSILVMGSWVIVDLWHGYHGERMNIDRSILVYLRALICAFDIALAAGATRFDLAACNLRYAASITGLQHN
jgi:hypothetical protein